MKKTNQKHSGKGDNVQGSKFTYIDNFPIRKISIIVVLILLSVFTTLIIITKYQNGNSQIEVEPLTGPAFEKNSPNKLEVLILPFNNTRDCNQYVSDYELAFSNRLFNLASKYNVPLNVKLFNCDKNFDDRNLMRTLELKYPDANFPEHLKYYNTAVANNADVVIFGIYEENCIDSSYVNVDCAIATPNELLSFLALKNFGDSTTSKVNLLNEITKLFFPNSNHTIDKIQDINSYHLDSPAKYTKFDRMVELENLDKFFNIDYLILTAFAESAIKKGNLDEGLDFYKIIIDNYQSESLIYRMKFSEPIEEVVINKYDEGKYSETIDLINKYSNNSNDKYIFKFGLTPRLYVTKIMCYVKLKDIDGAYDELERQKKMSKESVYHLISYIISSITILNNDQSLKYPVQYIENASSLRDLLNSRDSLDIEKLFDYLTLKIIIEKRSPEYIYSRLENSKILCLQNFSCVMISYWNNEIYTFFNLQQYYDHAYDMEGAMEICNNNYEKAGKILEKIKTKKISTHIKLAKCYQKTRNKKATKSNLMTALKYAKFMNDTRTVYELNKTVSQFDYFYQSGKGLAVVDFYDQALCKKSKTL